MKTSLKAKLHNLKVRQTNINKYSATTHLVYNIFNNTEDKFYIILSENVSYTAFWVMDIRYYAICFWNQYSKNQVHMWIIS